MSSLVPYLFLYGRCAEALDFYKNAFGGSYTVMRAGDSPMASQLPPDQHDRVMHARFTSGDIVFQLSDGRDTKTVDPDAGNVSLSLEFEDAARGEAVYKALAEGGNPTMPIDTAFWGGRFGTLIDKFGTEWLVSLP